MVSCDYVYVHVCLRVHDIIQSTFVSIYYFRSPIIETIEIIETMVKSYGTLPQDLIVYFSVCESVRATVDLKMETIAGIVRLRGKCHCILGGILGQNTINHADIITEILSYFKPKILQWSPNNHPL